MIEFAVLAIFCALLLWCVVFGFSILYALSAGLVLFWLYGRHKGLAWGELFKLSVSGVKTVKNILITFMLIGMLTALWREAGTIPIIVCYAAQLISPALFLLMTFLLNCFISVLTGTSFGTAATMGVICAAIGSTMQVNQVLTGGAVLSGTFFGDRCSPVSTSALLVAEVTGTNIFNNIKNMVRSAVVPFLASCALYAAIGFVFSGTGEVLDLEQLFGREFNLSLLALLPAIAIFIMAALRIDVKIAMLVSILTALPVCVFVQHTPLASFPKLLWAGYAANDAQLAPMLNGGGITSMLNVSAIIFLSATYTGIFQKTGLLNNAKLAINLLAQKTTAFAAILATAVISAVIACNQVLAIMLTHQLCRQLVADKSKMALNLEDTAVVVAALVPWSIACAVPLASIGAPPASIAFACFLYLLPLWRLFTESYAKHRR